MSDTVIPVSAFFYEEDFAQKNTFFNSVYALDLSLESNFSNMLFYGDQSRVVYASNEYCFRKRTSMDSEGLLDIPFINYYLKSMSPDTERFLWKNSTNVQMLLDNGYASVLGYGIKIVPIHLEYEATAWFSQDKDLQYATSKLLFQNTNETILYGELTSSNGTIIKNPAFLSYSFDFKPTYNENEWLETNNITSIGMDFSIDTFIIYPDTQVLKTPQPIPNVLSITNEVILNFLSTKGELLKNENLLNTQPQDLLTMYFSNGD